MRRKDQNWKHTATTSSLIITQKNGDRHTVVIDREDYDVVKSLCWHVIHDCLRYYVATITYDDMGLPIHSLLHRLILSEQLLDENDKVTFVDGNPRNCRRGNMRIVSHLEACQTRSEVRRTNTGHRGVFRKPGGFQVFVGVWGKTLSRYFPSLDEAIKWRDRQYRENGFRLEGIRKVPT